MRLPRLLAYGLVAFSLAAVVGCPKPQLVLYCAQDEEFAKGIFDTKDVIYYLNFTILALFVGLKSLEARRWKG